MRTYFIYKDKRGTSWKLYPRGYWIGKLTSTRRLNAYKQAAADDARKRGLPTVADAIEKQDMFRFIDDVGLVVRRERLDSKGRVVR